MQEVTVENRDCRNCAKPFAITDRDLEFYTRIAVPPPTWCPDCRVIRRMAWCNEGALYPDTCVNCKKRIVSQFHPPTAWPVMCYRCWWGDSYDATSHGRDFDVNRSAFEQFFELERAVPHACVSSDLSNENSEYTHHAGQEKNCYLIFHATFCEDCYYGYGVKRATNCVDVHYCFESELCYECIDVNQCYGLAWCQDCNNCSDSYFLRDCIGCSHCFLCVGIRNKSYYFLNEPLSRDEYERRLAAVNFGSRKEIQYLLSQLQLLESKHTFKPLRFIQTENCRGDYLINAKHAIECFDCRDVEDCKYCQQLQLGSRHSFDIYQFGVDMELCYEGAMIGTNAYRVLFSNLCIWQVSNLEYCFDCYSSKDCLLCYGLRNTKYCILNKPYSEEEYKSLRSYVIDQMRAHGEYGEYFPIQSSQFGYNETMAQLWYPLTRSDVLKRGWKWQDGLPGTKGKETQNIVPDDIRTLAESVTKEIFACSSCDNNFKVIAPEFKFYRKHGYPLPDQCFDCRRKRRLKTRMPRRLRDQVCPECATSFVTTVPDSGNFKVVCEECYLKSIK